MKRRALLQFAGMAAAGHAPLVHSQASAPAFPNRPIRWIVPFAAGGGTDVIVRPLARALETSLGQPILVDNKPGAATIVGAQALLAAPSDGYTWMAANIDTLAANPHLYKRLPYNVNQHFDFGGLFVRWPLLLVSNKGFGPEGAAALLASLKNAKEINYASYGLGTMPHLGMELLARQLGVPMTHVSYKGSAPALQGLMGGEVQLMLMDLTTALPQIKAGTIKAYAMATKERSLLLPELPTLQEVGVRNFDIYSWAGVILPRGVDPQVLSRISAALDAAVRSPDYRKLVLERGAEPLNGTPEQFKSLVASDAARLRRVVEDNKISLD